MNSEVACKHMHEVAIKELGVREGASSPTPRILEYDRHTSLKATSDKVPWCSAFVNWVVDSAGFKGTGSAAARSWLEWGVPLKEPLLGCVVILKRGEDTSQGHATLCDHPNISNGFIRCIGGNQSNSVKVSRFLVGNVLGYRAPL